MLKIRRTLKCDKICEKVLKKHAIEKYTMEK